MKDSVSAVGGSRGRGLQAEGTAGAKFWRLESFCLMEENQGVQCYGSRVTRAESELRLCRT